MNEFLLFLAGLPNLVLYVLIGAILGGAGGLLGTLLNKTLNKNWGLYLAVGAAVSTPVVAKEFVMPRMIEAVANQDLPMMVDEVTKLVKIEYYGKRFIYHYELDESVPADADLQAVKMSGLPDMCEYWKPQFASDEIRAVEYRYLTHGSHQSFNVEASDCSAD